VLKKNNWDLSLLKSSPEESQKVWRSERKAWASMTVGSPSSGYRQQIDCERSGERYHAGAD